MGGATQWLNEARELKIKFAVLCFLLQAFTGDDCGDERLPLSLAFAEPQPVGSIDAEGADTGESGIDLLALMLDNDDVPAEAAETAKSPIADRSRSSSAPSWHRPGPGRGKTGKRSQSASVVVAPMDHHLHCAKMRRRRLELRLEQHQVAAG